MPLPATTEQVIKEFEKFEPKGRLAYYPLMDGMLGRHRRVGANLRKHWIELSPTVIN